MSECVNVLRVYVVYIFMDTHVPRQGDVWTAWAATPLPYLVVAASVVAMGLASVVAMGLASVLVMGLASVVVMGLAFVLTKFCTELSP